jgi:hypothetical protein
MKLKNVPRNIPRYSKRLYYYHKNNAPFLSGDLFADSADIQMYPPKLRNLQPSRRSVSAARVIFCPSDELERFLDDYSGSINARVLILGNGDRDFDFLDESLLPASINKIFVQNLHNEGERSSLLPIGIENLRLGTNGLRKYFSESYVNTAKQEKILVGPFSMTHSDRDFYNNAALETSERFTILRGRIAPGEFAEISSKYRFVAAPRGNGIDTHRFWEALYRGSYPVVNKSSWSSLVKNLNIPLIEIDSWEENSFNSVPARMQNMNPRNIPALWWPFWNKLINSYC